MIYDILCPCGKKIGESDLQKEDYGIICQYCDQAQRLRTALAEGKSIECQELYEQRPEKMRQIVEEAVWNYPEKMLLSHYYDTIEIYKQEIMKEYGLDHFQFIQQKEVIELFRYAPESQSLAKEQLIEKIKQHGKETRSVPQANST